jgi:hypothetical protein
MKTYVVRVHEPEPGGQDADRLRGVVDEVRTGRRATFTSAAQLVGLLAGIAPDADEPSSSPDEHAPADNRPPPPPLQGERSR